MPCCAFAVFLVSQLVWPVRKALSFLPFGSRFALASGPDAATTWRPGVEAPVAAAPSTPSRGPVWRRGLAAMMLIELALAGGSAAAAYGLLAPSSSSAATQAEIFARFDALHTPICRSLGLLPAETDTASTEAAATNLYAQK